MRKIILKRVIPWIILACILVIVAWFFQAKKVISTQNELITKQYSLISNSITWAVAESKKTLDNIRKEMSESKSSIEELKTKKAEIDQNLFDEETNYMLLLDAANIIKSELSDSFWLN